MLFPEEGHSSHVEVSCKVSQGVDLVCVCVRIGLHSAIALWYLSIFFSSKETVLFSKSHSRPMKVVVDANGMSLEVCHGMPRNLEMSWMSSML